jgi:hypothetical protein
VAELWRLGVRHLTGSRCARAVGLTPEALVTGLATSTEARLRAALVPLFLRRPDYAPAARRAAEHLTGTPRITLQCCYSAAVALQARHAVHLPGAADAADRLPDLFDEVLELSPATDPDARLAAIGARHAVLTAEPINWRGTYEHAAAAFVRTVEGTAAWTP